jgi:tol-pal system protein YbgF
MRKPPILIIVAMLASSALSGVASAQADLSALLDRLTRLEQDLNGLQRKVYRDGTGGGSQSTSTGSAVSSEPLPTDVAGRLEVRMTKIEAELRSLTGTVERVNHDISVVNNRLDKLVEDVDHRLSQLESGAAGMGTGGNAIGSGQATDAGVPQSAPGPQTLGTLTREQIEAQSSSGPIQPFVQDVKLPDGPPEEQYNFAFDLLRKKEYDQAAGAFGSFVEMHPDHELAGNAQYWLGETHYARRDFERAAIAFAEGYKTYGKSSKAPDNMLKLGMSLAEIGNTDQACTAFSKLSEAYPNASATIRQRAATERRRNNCQ